MTRSPQGTRPPVPRGEVRGTAAATYDFLRAVRKARSAKAARAARDLSAGDAQDAGRAAARHRGGVDYSSPKLATGLTGAGWDAVVRELLVDRWTAEYDAVTPWAPEIVEIELGTLAYLFDAAPTSREPATGGDDRVVVVWGRSSAPTTRRDPSRLAGFIAVPGSWSGRGRDRGHLVAHALGGALDLNLVPQSSTLNRGRSEEGRRWRALERLAAASPGTPLFVRPIYADATWSPTEFEYGLVRGGGLHVERFQNRP